MASFVGINDKVYVAHLNLTALTDQVNFGDVSRVMVNCTTFNDAGYTCVKPGLISGTATIHGYQDYATDVLDDEISVGQLGNQYPISVAPTPTGTSAVGDVAWFSRGILAKLNPMDGAKGDMAAFMMEHAYDTALIQGYVGHAGSAVTTSGSDSSIALVGPSASQKLYAALHVTAYSGFTSVTFSVESDDNVGFTSPTTRITFTAATGTTSQFASVAGSFSSETRHRIVYTAAGSGSVTFFAVLGVI